LFDSFPRRVTGFSGNRFTKKFWMKFSLSGTRFGLKSGFFRRAAQGASRASPGDSSRHESAAFLCGTRGFSPVLSKAKR
jgi:hypothetical protein